MPTKSKLVYLAPAAHDFEEIVKTAFEKGKIEITKEDYLKK